jgi:hypothetical protein
LTDQENLVWAPSNAAVAARFATGAFCAAKQLT